MNLDKFEEYLQDKGLSKNTVLSYSFTVRQFYDEFEKLTKKSLQEYKGWLIDKYNPKTVNLRIRAINSYLEFIGKENMKITSVKIQQKAFLENVISEADYEYLKTCLKNDGDTLWYFIVRYMGATGVRVSELTEFKIEHVKKGYVDIYSKGGKLRRIYIPISLREETYLWLEEEGRKSGFLFLNKYGEKITTRGIGSQLKVLAKRYGINPDVVYPHSFRHRFAKSFLERYNDLSLLADLLGHESIETTRIYLRKTSTEQQEIVDRIVNW